MKRAKKWLVGILAALSLSCIGVACASCSLDMSISNTESSVSTASNGKDDEVQEEKGTEGLVYYPLDDGTYAVEVSTAKYLSTIVIPSTYNGKAVTTISENGFENGKAEEIKIPNGVTNIGELAFADCSSLTSITIPNSVTSIGKYAFAYCSSLTSVVFENTSEWWYSSNSSATSGTSIVSSSLANSATAAKYLTSTYCEYYWKRS